MSHAVEVNETLFEKMANDATGPVALHLRQRLLPVEGEGAVVFPPTYAEIGYNIDELSDGSKVATIDSVGSQANRIEPIFKAGEPHRSRAELAALVPQIAIEVGQEPGRGSVSILDAGHRLGDALVRSSTLRADAETAFKALLESGDAEPIAKLAPTSLLFGVWDSRGTFAKVPRIVQAVIRAWNVEELRRSAQYNTPVDYTALDVFTPQQKAKDLDNPKSPVAMRGFAHVPAVNMPGGVVARGEIRRDVTINLIALRRLEGKSDGKLLRRYILGLALVAASEPLDGFLRQGCLLTPDPKAPASWELVERTGQRSTVALTPELALSVATAAAKRFVVGASRSVKFDKQLAVDDLGEKKKEDGKKEDAEGSKSPSRNRKK